MNKKTLTIRFFSIEKTVGTETPLLHKNEIVNLLRALQRLDLDRSSSQSRFYDDGIDERCMIFNGERNRFPAPHFPYFVPGLFIKRRASNYPFENDDQGNLMPIKLSDEHNELAEVTYFVVDTSIRVLLLVNNKYVGSSKSFEEYINYGLQKAQGAFGEIPVPPGGANTRIVFPFIVNEDPEADFDLMENISSLEIRVAGSLRLAEEILTGSADDSATVMRTLAQYAQKSRAHTLNVTLSSGRGHTDRLDKREIKRLYRRMKRFFESTEDDHKFSMKGNIDEETRYLDLLNAEYFHRSTFEYEGRYVPLDTVFTRLYSIFNEYRGRFIQQNGFEEEP